MLCRWWVAALCAVPSPGMGLGKPISWEGLLRCGAGSKGRLSVPRSWKGLVFVAGKDYWLWVCLIQCTDISNSNFKVYVLILWNLHTHTHAFYLPLVAESELVLVAVIAKNLSGRQQSSPAPNFLI